VRTWGRYFAVYALFGLALGTVYYVRTEEWVGSVLLWTMGLMPAIVIAYAARRGVFGGRLPEDDLDADPAADAGEDLGEFQGASAWPLIVVLAVVAIGAALVYGLILLPIGVGLLGWAVLGLMRESRD
jgi:hypothetical protein